MSHGKIRHEKDCLNCGHYVEERFCPHCGQENTETRQPFHFLFTHFIEDLTHYDGQFWGTIKNLLFKPGKLTNTYLEGKRQIFVPPVKLYIFVSFITFFVFTFFPTIHFDNTHNPYKTQSEATAAKKESQAKREILMEALESLKNNDDKQLSNSIVNNKIDSLRATFNKNSTDEDVSFDLKDLIDADNGIGEDGSFLGYKTQEDYDKGTKNKIAGLTWLQDAFAHKYFELKEQGVKKGEIYTKILQTSFHNLPKALFIYLPIFAFFLWIFHNKKKWWYFDHGIFTLHYFSFLLLTILIAGLGIKLSSAMGTNEFLAQIVNFFLVLLMIYSGIYFFIAHHRVYKSHGIISILIGWFIFLLNAFAFSFLVVAVGLISFIMMH
ncbi:Protein of unknown function [Soonwooa buanensis]|uniref:DUF3667 domain-containing protein n=1 Tax=Soonwooa buanensis TaxID=619805 RepID=A0A1T5FLE6_9FLAO|nr:DUF3667 domain-containing protein [Soonwooa buanensis]SKB96906.1 Protein of unknown function [Soonwooa buanensis]